VDQAVVATAEELFRARHYPSVVAVATDALDDEPEHVPMLLWRARAHIALRRDLDAQADLRDIIRLQPQCPVAYRLLGELAARRDEHESAAIFFREALRLDPDDREAADWLRIVDHPSRPAAAAQKLPAPAAAAGRFPSARGPIERPQTGGARSLSSPSRVRGSTSNEERPTDRYGTRRPTSPDPPRRWAVGSEPSIRPIVTAAVTEPLKTEPGAAPLRRPSRPSIPELPGFGEYLVQMGILTRERLRAAQAYQRSMKVQLSTAIVTLGLATPQRIEWAAVAHQAQLGGAG
jgi:tetratricopeptide (TPR) repeat protein